jgi:hypothetical protein
MFLAYIRLIFRGSFVEITTAILLVYKILKKSLDVFGYWYLYRSCCFHYRLVGGLLYIKFSFYFIVCPLHSGHKIKV